MNTTAKWNPSDHQKNVLERFKVQTGSTNIISAFLMALTTICIALSSMYQSGSVSVGVIGYLIAGLTMAALHYMISRTVFHHIDTTWHYGSIALVLLTIALVVLGLLASESLLSQNTAHIALATIQAILIYVAANNYQLMLQRAVWKHNPYPRKRDTVVYNLLKYSFLTYRDKSLVFAILTALFGVIATLGSNGEFLDAYGRVNYLMICSNTLGLSAILAYYVYTHTPYWKPLVGILCIAIGVIIFGAVNAYNYLPHELYIQTGTLLGIYLAWIYDLNSMITSKVKTQRAMAEPPLED